MLCNTPACCSTFYQCAMVPTLFENSIFLCICIYMHVFVYVSMLVFPEAFDQNILSKKQPLCERNEAM